MMDWIKKFFRKQPRCYVITYDRLDEETGDEHEEYYGYFSSPQEARQVWSTFVGDQDLWNVKLCLVEEEWPSTSHSDLESKIYDEQYKLIKDRCGKEVAEKANYGWAVGANEKMIDVCTKVYGFGKLSSLGNYETGS